MEKQDKEQAIMKITVELGRDSYKHHQRFMLFRWQFLLLLLLGPLALVWVVNRPKERADWIAAAVFYVIFQIIVTASLLCSKPYARIMAETRPLPTTYTFYENVLQTQGGELFVRRLELLQYELFGKCYETKHAFYMTRPRGGIIILDKTCFGEAESAALRELFARKFEKEFKSKV